MHGKLAAQRVIELMITDNKIKMNGKQSCYFMNHFFTSCSEGEFAMLDTKYKEVEDLAKTCRDNRSQVD